ncbi:MAG: hypothetical protein JNN11_00280 [Candidatus Doudnabacteria bacterium]|nr:hypothetical protein [Candidatus Doudnabacteria bacterium]
MREQHSPQTEYQNTYFRITEAFKQPGQLERAKIFLDKCNLFLSKLRETLSEYKTFHDARKFKQHTPFQEHNPLKIEHTQAGLTMDTQARSIKKAFRPLNKSHSHGKSLVGFAEDINYWANILNLPPTNLSDLFSTKPSQLNNFYLTEAITSVSQIQTNLNHHIKNFEILNFTKKDIKKTSK